MIQSLNFKILLAFFIGTLFFITSCKSRNLVYFSDLPSSGSYNAGNVGSIDPQVQTGDLLGIRVNSLSTESNSLFNRENAEPGKSTDGYLVDKQGNITFPVIGKVKLSGLTIEQSKEKLATEIQKYVKNPTVNVRLLNFKVTVIGEVLRPSSFTIEDQRINILEALGMAGDMTPFGKRENVLVIRQKDGARSLVRLNLNEKDVFNSPYFNLQQNDVIYVEPDKSKQQQNNPNFRYITIVTGILTAASIFISRVVLN